MKTLIWVSVAVVVALGLIGGAVAWIASRQAGALRNAGETVVVEPVGRGELVEFIQAPGELEPRTRVMISAKIASRVKELPFKEGDRVKADEVLVRLDDTDLQAQCRATAAQCEATKAQLAAAKANLAASKARIETLRISLADAERNLGRLKGLLEVKDVSLKDVEDAQRQFDQAKIELEASLLQYQASELGLSTIDHQVEAAQAAVAREQETLSYTTIRSPIDGVVTSLNTKVGEMCITGTMNNPGTMLLEVADLSQMLLVARVDEADISSVEPGQEATVRIQAYPDSLFEGKVATVALVRMGASGSASAAAAAAGNARVYKVEVLLKASSERLRSGLSAEVEIHTKRYTDVLKVPTQAVLGRPTTEIPPAVRDSLPNLDKKKPTATVVYRYINGEAVITPVEVGASDLTHTVIKSGLNEGDRVITGPFEALDRLNQGKKVKEQTSTTKPTTSPTTVPTTQAVNGKSTQGEMRQSPKPEIRIPNQTRMTKSETRNSRPEPCVRVSSFVIDSDFGLRISGFQRFDRHLVFRLHTGAGAPS